MFKAHSKYKIPILIMVYMLIGLLCACSSNVVNNSSTVSESPLTPYAFAIAMANYNKDGSDNLTFTDPFVMWDAISWYSSYISKEEDREMSYLTNQEIIELQKILNPDGDYLEIPLSYLDMFQVEALSYQDKDIYTFPYYETDMDEHYYKYNTLQYQMKNNEHLVTIICNHLDKSTSGITYSIKFKQKGEQVYFSEITALKEAINLETNETIEKLSPYSLYYEQLNYKHSFSTIKKNHGFVAIKRYSNLIETGTSNLEDVTYLYSHNGDDAYIYVSNPINPTYTIVLYRGIWIEELSGDYMQITANTADLDTANNFVEDYINYIIKVQPMLTNYIEANDQIIIIYKEMYDYESYGIKEIYIDKDTLLVQKIMFYNNDNHYSYIFEYGADTTQLDFLDNWNDNLRLVTFVTKTHNQDDTVDVDTISYLVPGNLEVQPPNSYSYSIYLDESYTKPYVYPGDNIDYTVFITNVMG